MEKDLTSLFAEYEDVCRHQRCNSKVTIRGYKAAFDLFRKIKPEIVYPEQLTTAVMADFFKGIQTRERVIGRGVVVCGVKNSTVATYWSKLESFFRWMVFEKHIESVPLRKEDRPKVDYYDKKALTRSEVMKLYASVAVDSKDNLIYQRDRCIITTLIYTGVRRGELLGLQVGDLNLHKGTITIRKETSKSKRTRLLPIHSMLRHHLREYLEERKRRGYKTEMLFVSSNEDKGLTGHGYKHWVKRLIRNSGVKFHLHRFRHTFACNLVDVGIHPAKIQVLMGHTDLRMTMRYLRSIGAEDCVEDIEKLSIESMV